MTPFPLPTAWSGEWVEPVEAAGLPDVHRPAYHLVGELTIDEPVREAVLHATAHGVYEAFLNGNRIGDVELTPGFTAYRKRLQVHSFDVTDLLVQGSNAVGFLLSDGWWRGQTTVARKPNRFGTTVGVLAELHITYASGRTVVHGTGASWRSKESHVLAADLIAGERHDLRRRVGGWCAPGTDRTSWSQVRVVDHGTSSLCAPIGPAVRRTDELPAVSVREVAPGRHVVDFGRTSNGWLRLTDLGPEGTELTIEYAESLTPDGGDVANAHHETFLITAHGVPVPFQTDVVVSAGDGSVFEPRHSTKGFRYVRIDGHPGPLPASALTSVVVRNDLQRLGSFSCSDADLDALHRAAEWSLLTNCCDIPMDCPTRERAGWTGDWQIFVGTAAFLYDVTDFSRKWLADVAADQRPNGAITHFSPEPADFSDPATDWWRVMQGSAGWGDAIVHVPWQLYLSTGRTEVLEESYDAMRRWVDFAAAQAASGRHADRAASRPQPAEHERYLWDTGFHFGEWNEPGAEQSQLELVRVMDHGPTATAYLHRSADELATIARILGDSETAERYAVLAVKARDAWQAEFIDERGQITPSTQANLVRALAFGLVPDRARPRAVADLVRLIREAGTHLGTGFLATPFLLPVLADNGEVELAYELLLQRSRPSWLAMIDAGATTIWEGWDSLREDGTTTSSLNHFSMGAVISFLHRYTAGVRLVEPGYRRFAIQPVLGGGLTEAATSHVSPYGEIEVSWCAADDKGSVDVTVPDGTTADLLLPDGSQEQLPAGRHHRAWRLA
jgi:alpha-L-rhamnosidase